MEKKNKIILTVVAAAVVAAIIIVGVLSSKPKNDSGSISSNTSNTASTSQATEQPIWTPTFMYFVSQQDEQYQEALDVFAKLEAEYGDQINFELQDMDADPSLAQSFEPVAGQTPALIMLDIHNDISNFLFKTTDETQLRDAILKALGE